MKPETNNNGEKATMLVSTLKITGMEISRVPDTAACNQGLPA